MKAVVAARNAAHGVLRKVIAEADGAGATVVGPGEAAALSDDDLRVGLDGGLFQAQDDGLGPTGVVNVVILFRLVVMSVVTSARRVRFEADAGVGGEHDGGDEDEDADGDGNAVAETNAGGGNGGGGWRRRREH